MFENFEKAIRGKLITRSSLTAQERANNICRLFVTDRNSSNQYLIDTEADVSVIPKVKSISLTEEVTKLYAANNTVINTYGQKLVKLDLGLRRCFSWPFIIADVNQCIVGIDFLKHFGLLLDAQNQCLIDRTTLLTTKVSNVSSVTHEQFSLLSSNNKYKILLNEFPDLLKANIIKSKTKEHGIEHVIETTGRPVFAKTRRLEPEKLKTAKDEFEFMTQQGICRPSSSPWSSPLHLAVKKTGDWRPCGDYRSLNKVTIPDRYPITFLTDCVNILENAKIFTTLDLKRAYHHIPIRESDVQKTAIITPFGLFEFTMMTFGLRNASQTFLRFMNKVLGDLPYVFRYIDDVFIASPDQNMHKKHLTEVLKRLNDYGLSLNEA